MPESLRGKTALVTGSAVRIGRQIALALADEGVNVVLHFAHSGKEAEDAGAELRARGVKAWHVWADFTKQDELDALMPMAIGTAGRLDFLVNNSAIFPRETLAELSWEQLEANIRINAWAPLVLCRSFARLAGAGKIVNIIDSRVTGFDWSHAGYILSKHLPGASSA
jgi:pteridine reductase